MKKLTACIAVVLVLSAEVKAQKYFEGNIEFKLSVMGEGADKMSAFMPSGYNMHFSSSGDLLFKTNGGMMAGILGEIISKGKNGESYLVKRNEKTVYKMPAADITPKTLPVIQKENETITISGYKCQKYKVTTKEANNMTQVKYVWVTDQIIIKKPKGNIQTTASVFVDGISGFPLKIMTEMMGITTVMTCITINKTKPDPSLFVIPKNYTVKPFDPSVLFGN